VWNASADNVGVAGYNIYRDGSKVATSPYPVYSDTGLTSGTNYCYQVEAFDGAVNVSAKGPTTAVCATTLAAADTTAPSAPTGLTATVASASQIDLSWTASASTDVAGYAIYRDTIKVATVNGTSYSDKGLSSGTLYSYTVKALDGALNYSADSNTATATTQAGTGVSQFDGTYTGGAGTISLNLTVSNGVITGTFSGQSTSGPVSGAVSASGSVSMTFSNSCSATVTFTGQATSSGGDSMTGTASAPAAGTCAVVVAAPWTATRIGASQFNGTYTGTLNGINQTNGAVTLTLSVANGVVTGSITQTVVKPVSEGTISASGLVTMTTTDDCGAIVTFTGQTVIGLNSSVMTGTASGPAMGICGVVSGTWTATRQ
jgi:chitodextrinase